MNGWLADQNSEYRISILNKPTVENMEAIYALFDQLKSDLNIEFAYGRGHRKPELQRFFEKFDSLVKRLDKYFTYEEIADGRSSFSKTDHDATFMHLKYDYYNHTNVFKPAYNVQIGVSSGYIRVVHVSQNANDLHDFIPTVEKYREMYGEYPAAVPADAGYGSYDNYSFCKEKGIDLMMKYPGQNAARKITEKTKFRSCAFGKTEDGIPVCPEGHVMDLIRVRTDTHGVYPREISYYKTPHCKDCPMRTRCTKAASGRTIQVCHQLEAYKAEVRENMSTDEGHELMVSRSIQAEGTFGELKNDFDYDRLERRGLKNVEFELLMVSCGHNLRKFLNRNRLDPLSRKKYGRQKYN